jgi:signal transduction histidine kinase
MISSIRTRLTYQFILLVTAILLFFSAGVYFFSKLYLEKRFYKRLQDRAITTTTLLFDLKAPDTTVLKLVDVPSKELLIDEAISIYNENSKQIIFSTNNPGSDFHQRFIQGFKPDQESVFRTLGEYQILGIRLKRGKQSNWVIVSAIDINGIEALEDLRKILIVMVLAGALLLAILGWLFADRAISPIADIITQVNSIFPNNTKKRLKYPNQQDEIGALVRTFNEMLERVEQALVTQKMFIANVSHELKNPLTKIYAQIDLTLLKKRSPEEYEGNLASLKDDTKTLIQLTNTLLDLAQTVINSDTLKFAPVRIDELLWEARSQVQKWHEGYKIQLIFNDFPEDENTLLIDGNEASLKVVLMNLIENACKFANNNTAIVEFSVKSDQILISVFNEGPEIPAEDIKHIFQPFYRSRATADANKGHGVGLAIVLHITKVHHGEITVDSTEKGTTFTLKFPVRKPATVAEPPIIKI